MSETQDSSTSSADPQGPAASLSAAAGRPGQSSSTLGERIHAVKAVTFNEQFFQGHFPGRPIMPGVLQIEALAQAAAILGIETLELAGTGKLVYFMAIEDAKFRAPVTPGCLLDLQVEFIQKRSRVYKFEGKASVEGKMTCDVRVHRDDRRSARRTARRTLASCQRQRSPLSGARFPTISWPVGTGPSYEGHTP